MAADVRADERETLSTSDTIFALASGQPPAAIAVVRISGPAALDALARLASLTPEARRAHLVGLRHDGELLDRAIALWFDAPATVTGEDIVELHLHGGRAVVSAVLDALARQKGLRPAMPGEFTRRAFENTRLDLTQVEGLADLLAAETEAQRRAAMRMAGGALTRQVAGWTQRLLLLAATVEAVLDFAEEDDVATGLPVPWTGERMGLQQEIAETLGRPPAERLRDGVRVVIAGPPNVGKSTLLNAIVGRDASITSAIAGTTRDLIEAPLAIAGVPFVFTDTAGLRAIDDPVEVEGVQRAQAAASAADIVLWLGPGDLQPQRANVLWIHPKCDLGSSVSAADIAVSAVTGQGMDTLFAALVGLAGGLLPLDGEAALNARQRAALVEVIGHLQASDVVDDPLLVAEELRLARVALDRVTGGAGTEDMLDQLFGRFCIGK